MPTTHPNGKNNRSTSELVRELSEQSTRLIRQEMALARAELTEKGVEARFGMELLGAAGVLSLYGLGALAAAAILLLATTLKAWLAATIVGGGILIVAASAALMGKAHLARTAPPIPEATIETARQDLDTIRASIREGRA